MRVGWETAVLKELLGLMSAAGHFSRRPIASRLVGQLLLSRAASKTSLQLGRQLPQCHVAKGNS